MKNSIITEYVADLKKLLKSNPDLATTKVINQLIQDLPKLSNVDALLKLLWNYTLNKDDLVSAKLYDKLDAWVTYLVEIDSLKDNAIQNLNDIEHANKYHSLKSFLLQLLNDERTMLHNNTNSLLHFLTDGNIQNIFSFIVNLKAATHPYFKSSGSFFSIAPVNEDHKACIQLLSNVTYKYDDRDVLSRKANGLLQTALHTHLDLNLEEKVEEEDFELNTVDNSSWCTIL